MGVSRAPGRDFVGAVAVVVGGSKGIGATAVRQLADRGAIVAVAARDPAAGARVVAEVTDAGGVAKFFPVEATDYDSVQSLHDQVEDSFGPIDVYLPFSGGPGTSTGLANIGPEQWRETLESNLTSTFFGLRVFVPPMVKRGGGAVVTMSSTAGRVADTTTSLAYGAAKAAVVHLTKSVALEVAGAGVRVNCVAPGTTLSERVQGRLASSPELEARILAMVPMARLSTPDEVASAAVFLASPAASALTGVTIDASLGRVMN